MSTVRLICSSQHSILFNSEESTFNCVVQVIQCLLPVIEPLMAFPINSIIYHYVFPPVVLKHDSGFHEVSSRSGLGCISCFQTVMFSLAHHTWAVPLGSYWNEWCLWISGGHSPRRYTVNSLALSAYSHYSWYSHVKCLFSPSIRPVWN